jgi:hypothetical protein
MAVGTSSRHVQNRLKNQYWSSLGSTRLLFLGFAARYWDLFYCVLWTLARAPVKIATIMILIIRDLIKASVNNNLEMTSFV